MVEGARGGIEVPFFENAEAFFTFGGAGPEVRLKQIHGNQGQIVTREGLTNAGEGDWLATFEQKLSIGVAVADCTACLVEGTSAKGTFVGAIHAGWRGTAAQIIREFKVALSPQKAWRVWLSPSICQEHFEVGPEVPELLGEESRKYCRPSRSGKFLLNLKAYQKEIFEYEGATVFTSSLCTSCQPEFFSYRRDMKSGNRDSKNRHWASIKMS